MRIYVIITMLVATMFCVWYTTTDNREATIPVQTADIEAHAAPEPTATGNLTVSVLDVGQGDAVLVRTPAGKIMLVDAGDSDAGRIVVDDLRQAGVANIDVAIASHAHADHIGGFKTVLDTFPVWAFYDSGYAATSATYTSLLSTLNTKHTPFYVPTRGDRIVIDPGVTIDVISPDGREHSAIHDQMLVIRVSYGSVSCLLAGDLADDGEDAILASGEPVKSTMLKVGHHGSATSSTSPFLDAVSPDVAVISVGDGNVYGHPTNEALHRLVDIGTTTYRTDCDGTVTFTTDGDEWTILTER